MSILRWASFPAALVAAGAWAAFALREHWIDPTAIPTVVTLAALVVALLLERAMPRRRVPWEAGELRTDLGWVFVNGLVTAPLTEALAAGVAVAVAVRAGAGAVAGWSTLSQVVVGLLVMELGIYVVHRAAHGIPALWRLHAVHHAPLTMRALNNPRMHPVELLVRAMATYLPALLLGVGPTALAWLGAVRGVHLWFGHIDADLRYGPLNYLLNTASVHRWHHADDPERGAMSNYGGMLVVFDQLFGTFRLPPEASEPTGMGLFGVRTYPRHDLLRSIVAPVCWQGCTGGAPQEDSSGQSPS